MVPEVWMLRVVGRWSFVLLGFVACGGATAGGGAADGGSGSSSAASSAPDFEMVGPYRCCAPGIGTRCCDGVKQGMCFENGGIYGACRAAGEEYEGKVICARCCPGLERVSSVAPGNAVPASVDGLAEGCDDKGPPSIGVCIRCGDGVCGAGESFCNCPADCPR